MPDLGGPVGEKVLAASTPLLDDDDRAVAYLMKSRNVVGAVIPAADEYNAVSTGLHALEFSEAALACGMEDRNAGPVWLELELGPVGDHLEVLSAQAADAPTERAAAVATTDPEIVECVARGAVGLPVHGVEGLSFSIVFSVHPRRALDAERGVAKAVPTGATDSESVQHFSL